MPSTTVNDTPEHPKPRTQLNKSVGILIPVPQFWISMALQLKGRPGDIGGIGGALHRGRRRRVPAREMSARPWLTASARKGLPTYRITVSSTGEFFFHGVETVENFFLWPSCNGHRKQSNTKKPNLRKMPNQETEILPKLNTIVRTSCYTTYIIASTLPPNIRQHTPSFHFYHRCRPKYDPNTSCSIQLRMISS